MANGGSEQEGAAAYPEGEPGKSVDSISPDEAQYIKIALRDCNLQERSAYVAHESNLMEAKRHYGVQQLRNQRKFGQQAVVERYAVLILSARIEHGTSFVRGRRFLHDRLVRKIVLRVGGYAPLRTIVG